MTVERRRLGFSWPVLIALAGLAAPRVLWDVAFGGSAPSLDGIDPALGEGVLRGAALVSSIVTGALVGVVAGAVALLLCRLVPAGPARDASDRSPGEDGPRV